MLPRYLIAELEIIERKGQKLFYCYREDFAFNVLPAHLWGWVSAEIRISFDGIVFVSGLLKEIGTHASDMRFVLCHQVFNGKANSFKKISGQLLAKDFAVGDKITVQTVLKEDIPKRTVEMLIKYNYLFHGIEHNFVYQNQFITQREVYELVRQDRLKQDELETFFCVCDCAIPVKLVENMVQMLKETNKTGWDFFDKTKTIIFRRGKL